MNTYDLNGYQVSYHKQDEPDQEYSTLVRDPTKNSIIVTGLDSDSVYLIKLRAMTRFATSEPIVFNAKTAAYNFKAWVVDRTHERVKIGLAGGLTGTEKAKGYIIGLRGGEAV